MKHLRVLTGLIAALVTVNVKSAFAQFSPRPNPITGPVGLHFAPVPEPSTVGFPGMVGYRPCRARAAV